MATKICPYCGRENKRVRSEYCSSYCATASRRTKKNVHKYDEQISTETKLCDLCSKKLRPGNKTGFCCKKCERLYTELYNLL